MFLSFSFNYLLSFALPLTWLLSWLFSWWFICCFNSRETINMPPFLFCQHSDGSVLRGTFCCWHTVDSSLHIPECLMTKFLSVFLVLPTDVSAANPSKDRIFIMQTTIILEQLHTSLHSKSANEASLFSTSVSTFDVVGLTMTWNECLRQGKVFLGCHSKHTQRNQHRPQPSGRACWIPSQIVLSLEIFWKHLFTASWSPWVSGNLKELCFVHFCEPHHDCHHVSSSNICATEDNELEALLWLLLPPPPTTTLMAQVLLLLAFVASQNRWWQKMILVLEGCALQEKEWKCNTLICLWCGYAQSILIWDSFIRDSFAEDALLSAWD